MKTCPYCAEQIPDEAKVCKFCSSTVVRRCPLCAEQIPATAPACPFCRSAFPADGVAAGPPAPPAPRPRGTPLGQERGVAMGIVLTILTCGLWGLVLQYKIGDEINAHQGKGRIHAGVDLLLAFVTCGLWGIYLMYRYPRELQETLAEEGMPTSDLVVPCMLLSLFGLHIVAVAILQNELNRHWDAHRNAGA